MKPINVLLAYISLVMYVSSLAHDGAAFYHNLPVLPNNHFSRRSGGARK